MNGLTLKHLRYFDALARQRHFGRAAEVSGISQPALSVQIKELEALLGAPLIERTARQIRLTPLGEDFLARARRVLGEVDALGALAEGHRGAFGGRLRLGVIPTIAPYLLPDLMTALSKAYPETEIRPREAVTRRLITDLNDGRLDVAILALPVSEPALTEVPLFDEEFVLVRHASDANRPVPGADKLREMRLLLLEEGHCFRDQALSFCRLSNAPPKDLMEGSSLTTLVQMVGAGIGVTLIPEMAVAIETRSAQVAVARLHAPRPRRTIGMVYRKTSPLAGELGQLGAIVARHGEPRT